MVPIPGFQIANWVHSSLFGKATSIIRAAIMSEKTRWIDGIQEDVTGLVQRYCHFCHERIGRKVIFLSGLSSLAEFKAALKKISPPRLLVLSFSTGNGAVTSEVLYIDANGNIAETPGAENLSTEERIFRQSAFFSLEGIHDTEGEVSLDSVMNLPVISDWLRMEISLNSKSLRPTLSGMSLLVSM